MAGTLIASRLVALAVAATLAGGCGGDAAERAGREAASWIDPEGDEPVVGAVAVEPSGGGVWLSTNRGLYTVEGGTARQVRGTLRTPQGSGGIAAQLVVAFDRSGRMIGSGHPAASGDLPPVLGLIASRDRGRTWRSVSELGSADFHAFARSGRRLAAASYGESQVLVSDNDGRTWIPRAAPGVLVALALDPENPDRWVCTTADGVFTSADGGVTWRQRDSIPNGRLTWPAPDALFRVDGDARVLRSRDGGESWEPVGHAGRGDPAALAAADPSRLVYATQDGTVRESTDGGRSWGELLS